MYDSIPLAEVIKSLEKRRTEIEMVTKIPWIILIDMVKFCTRDTNYIIWDKIPYKQKMGSMNCLWDCNRHKNSSQICWWYINDYGTWRYGKFQLHTQFTTPGNTVYLWSRGKPKIAIFGHNAAPPKKWNNWNLTT